jgi:predicted PurR-regulated permease PerM
MNKNIQTNDPVVRFFISVIGIVFLAIILIELKSILIPYVLAVFLLFLFDPLHRKLKEKRVPLIFALFLDLVIIGLIIYGISVFVTGAINQFIASLPFYENRLTAMLQEFTEFLGLKTLDLSKLNILALLNELNVGNFAQNVLSSTVNVATSVFLVILFYVFSVFGHENIQRAFRKRIEFSQDNSNRISGSLQSWDVTYSQISEKIQHYFSVKFFLGLILALTTGLALWIFDVHFTIVWIVVTFLFYFIPTIGPFIAVLFPTLIALVQYQSFGYALFLLIILVALQTVVGNILEPKVLGDRLNINPLVILLSLFIWGYIWGIIGMLLAVPIMSTVKIILSLSESPNLKFLDELMSSHPLDE